MNLNLSKLPQNPGVYIFKDYSSAIIYIGKAKNLKKRISSYFSKQAQKSFKTATLKSAIKQIDYIICLGEKEALLIERELIKKHQPFFNTVWKDSKSYPYIKITKEPFPRITMTRQKERDKAFYLGPYAKVSMVKKVLSHMALSGLLNLRKCSYEFSSKNPLDPKKINSCLYYQTRQCPAPCDKNRINAKDYKKIVAKAKKLLSSDYVGLISDLKKEMAAYSKNLDYEKAAEIRDCLNALSHMSENIKIYEKKLDNFENTSQNLLEGIKNLLNLKKIPAHIEAFDVSTLFGKYSAGACVCFINSEKHHPHYRHYRIKNEDYIYGGNDFKMMETIVKKRLSEISRKNQPMPDLLLIDGGPGQLKKALAAAKSLKIDIEIAALAKRFEHIFLKNEKNPVILNKNSSEMLFIRRLRDEAHRFVINYHRKMRNKNFNEQK